MNFKQATIICLMGFVVTGCSSQGNLEATVAAQNTKIALLSGTATVWSGNDSNLESESTPFTQGASTPVGSTIAPPTPVLTSPILWEKTIQGQTPQALLNWGFAAPPIGSSSLQLQLPLLMQPPYQPFFTHDKSVFLTDGAGFPSQLDLETGNEIWKSEINASVLGVGQGTVLVYRNDHRLYALDIKTGAEKWHLILATLAPQNSRLTANGQIIATNGLILLPALITPTLGTVTPTLLVLQENPGKYLGELPGEQALIIKDNILVTQTMQDAVLKSAYVGRDISSSGKKIYSSVNLQLIKSDLKAGILYFEATNSPLDFTAFKMQTGENIWGTGLRAKSGLNLTNAQLIGITDKYMVISASEGQSDKAELLVFDKQSGSLITRFQPERAFVAYVTSNNIAAISYPELGTSFAIDLSNGKTIWQNDDLNLGGMNYTQAQSLTQLSAGAILVFSQRDGTFGLDTATGKVIWKIGQRIWYSSPSENVLYDGRIFYIDSDAKRLAALDPKTGNLVLASPSLKSSPTTAQHIHDDLWLVGSATDLALVRLAAAQ